MPDVPDVDLRRIRRFCQRRVPAHRRHEVRVEAAVRGKSVTIFECRPLRQPDLTGWSRVRVAQLRYNAHSHLWTLYRAERDGRWHLYNLIGPGAVAELLNEMDDDPGTFFWR